MQKITRLYNDNEVLAFTSQQFAKMCLTVFYTYMYDFDEPFRKLQIL